MSLAIQKQLAATTATLVAIGCNGPSVNPTSVNPTSVKFGAVTYKVERLRTSDGGFILTSANETVQLDALPSDTRHLSPCPSAALIEHDFDHDRRSDLALFTCSFLEIYIQSLSPLGATVADEAEFKEGRWIYIGSKKYPGINELTQEFVNRLDPDA